MGLGSVCHRSGQASLCRPHGPLSGDIISVINFRTLISAIVTFHYKEGRAAEFDQNKDKAKYTAGEQKIVVPQKYF